MFIFSVIKLLKQYRKVSMLVLTNLSLIFFFPIDPFTCSTVGL